MALAAVLMVATVGAGWYFRSGAYRTADAGAARLATSQPVEAVVEESLGPAGPAPEEIHAQVAAMLETRSQEMEDQLLVQYDAQIRQLQEQLEEAKEAARRDAEVRERQRLEAEQQAQEMAVRLAAAVELARTPVDEEGKGREATAQWEVADLPVPEPESPAARVGDLVNMGAGVTPPQLFSPPEVRYPAMAKKLAKEAEVEVRVLVDEHGNVLDATLMGKKAGFGFDQAALEAARNARYKPALKNGVRVKMYAKLTINFSYAGLDELKEQR